MGYTFLLLVVITVITAAVCIVLITTGVLGAGLAFAVIAIYILVSIRIVRRMLDDEEPKNK